ncbi:MAG TPA: zinc ribbon domain-containing protein [Mucilaginibacter sp.]|jgi:hypothetical protein|nr:zinc ribbon domain-containing protein [Mucilaginibacter sp.]
MDNQPPISHLSAVCPACGAGVHRTDEFCDNCHYPLKGTEHEQRSFMNEYTWTQATLKSLSLAVLRTVYVLYSLAGAFFIFSGVERYADRDDPDLRSRVFPVLLSSGFVFLLIALLSRKKQLAAFVAGTVAFITSVAFLYSYSDKGIDLLWILIVGIPLYVLVTGMSAAAKLKS